MSNLYVQLEPLKQALNEMYNEADSSLECYENDEQATISKILELLGSLPTINLSVIDEMIKENDELYKALKISNPIGLAENFAAQSTLREAKSRIQALGDGGGLFIIPGKTYYIGDNKIPAVALFPRFQYSNGTIDTIHHTNISDLPPTH